jgi:hypothetical protein
MSIARDPPFHVEAHKAPKRFLAESAQGGFL